MTWPTLAAALAASSAVLLCRRLRPRPPRRRSVRMSPWWPAPVAALALVATVGSAMPAAALLAGALLLAGGHALLAVRRRRAAAERASERVLETCELVASELVAGQSAEAALRRAAREWPALAPVAEAAELGGDPSAALVGLATTPGAGDLRLVAAAWRVAHRSGSGLADALDRVGSAIRERRSTTRVVESELASARATARLVAGLPVVMLVLGGGQGSGAWEFLLTHPLGVVCLVAGLALGLLGLWWIERLADGVQA